MPSLNTVTEAFRANINIYSTINSHNYCGFTEWPVKQNWNCIFFKRKVLNYVASLSLPCILRVLRFLVNINYVSYNKTQRFCLLCSHIPKNMPKSFASRLTICRLLPALRFCFYCYSKEKREATTGGRTCWKTTSLIIYKEYTVRTHPGRVEVTLIAWLL